MRCVGLLRHTFFVYVDVDVPAFLFLTPIGMISAKTAERSDGWLGFGRDGLPVYLVL